MTPARDDRLDSWKEIAVFLKRGVRTVQRWETTEGLPVHRHQHARLGSVYAFRAEVLAWWESRRRDLDSEDHSAATKGTDAAARVRLLVLPLENLSGDPSQDYLAEGFTEEIITQLARLHPTRLAVIARTTAMHFKGASRRLGEIARELGANYVLEGSVRRVADCVRVAAQLIAASDETHVWAQNYDRELRDVLALQSEVASAVAREIRLALDTGTPSRPKSSAAIDPQAYDHYLRGRYLLNRMTPQSIGQSIECFQRAVSGPARLCAGLCQHLPRLRIAGDGAVRCAAAARVHAKSRGCSRESAGTRSGSARSPRRACRCPAPLRLELEGC